MKSCSRAYERRSKTQSFPAALTHGWRGRVGFIAVVAALMLAGCTAARSHDSRANDPDEAIIVAQNDWPAGGPTGRVIETADYRIYSTVGDQSFNRKLAQLMQIGSEEYRRLAPSADRDVRPMECYVFADRRQWAAFTAAKLGHDATSYLQINRGAYTIHDFFVAYYLGESGTFAVASHEGWHQFTARHFKQRLPPFLEEGIASTFENVTWTPRGLPRWNFRRNPARSGRLKQALETDSLLPLSEIITMHAGDLIGKPPETIELFYAQVWAFARFLADGDAGRYRPALQKLCGEAVAGRLYPNQPATQRDSDNWFNPADVQPLLERSLGLGLADIDLAYRAFVREITMDAANATWEN